MKSRCVTPSTANTKPNAISNSSVSVAIVRCPPFEPLWIVAIQWWRPKNIALANKTNHTKNRMKKKKERHTKKRIGSELIGRIVVCISAASFARTAGLKDGARAAKKTDRKIDSKRSDRSEFGTVPAQIMHDTHNFIRQIWNKFFHSFSSSIFFFSKRSLL